MAEEEAGITPEQLDDWRQRHIGRLFLQAHRDFSGRTIAKLRARGHDALGLTHTALLPHIDLEGTRTTVLAERAGITKQAAGQLAADLERLGYLARAPDPADQRATLVTFTPQGWRFLRDAYEVKREMEAEYAAILGDEGLRALKEALATLLHDETSRDEREPVR